MKSIGLVLCAVLVSFLGVGCGGDEAPPADTPLGAIEEDAPDAVESIGSEMESTENTLKEETESASETITDTIEESKEDEQATVATESSDLTEVIEEVVETVVETVEETVEDNKDLLDTTDVKIPEKPKFQ